MKAALAFLLLATTASAATRSFVGVQDDDTLIYATRPPELQRLEPLRQEIDLTVADGLADIRRWDAYAISGEMLWSVSPGTVEAELVGGSEWRATEFLPMTDAMGRDWQAWPQWWVGDQWGVSLRSPAPLPDVTADGVLYTTPMPLGFVVPTPSAATLLGISFLCMAYLLWEMRRAPHRDDWR